VRVNNAGHTLRPNQFVAATFGVPAQAEVILVPADAVVTDGVSSIVFVEGAPGVLTRREVRVGRRTKDQVEILGGLQPGERVVVKGALLLLNAITKVEPCSPASSAFA
jgi:multidrug efflux pump subunit AcrA (membrane-fusion protein)